MNLSWPWPEHYRAAASWGGVRRLLGRCRELAMGGAWPGSAMVVGEPGLGREGFVVAVAALLTCREGAEPGCGCGSCDRVRRGMHPDVVVLGFEGKGQVIPIDAVRDDLLADLDLLPYEGARRVYILPSLHTPPLTAEAASAMLKVFEEPPDHVTILGLAANPARVLGTITSRAVQIRVPPPTVEELGDLLQRHHGCDAGQAREILTTCADDLAACLTEEAGQRGEVLSRLGTTLGSVLAGDGAAMTEVTALLHARPEAVWLVLAAVLRTLMTAGEPEDREFLLDVGAALLAAQRRSAALRLDADGAAMAAVAPLVLERMPGTSARRA